MDKNKNKYQSWSRDELILEINKLKKNKKYGISWDELVDNEIEPYSEYIPVIEDVKKNEINYLNNENPNVLIEGDNFLSLNILNYTHKNKIDLIYIDPPYNTGKKDEFKFNDKWIDENDNYRFSKWLSFMKKRLILAKDLLKNTGVLLISIDDHMQAPLKLLCDDIFGHNNFVSNFIWRGGKRNASKHISISHEYMLLYAKNLNTISEKKISWKSKKKGIENIYKHYNFLIKKYKNDHATISKYLKIWFKELSNDDPSKDHQHYCWSDKKGIYFASDISRGGGGGGKWNVKNPVTKENVQIPSRGWSFKNEAEMNSEIKKDKIHFNGKSIPCQKRYLKDMEYELIDTVFYKDRRSASQKFKDMMGNVSFQNPKDHEIIKYMIECFCPEDGMVLDFFAGSGTTAQSVLELNNNKINRKFILCTNNENKICTEICFPRISKIINGYKIKSKNVDGIKANLKYLKIKLLPYEKNDGNKFLITKRLSNIICLKENTFNNIESNSMFEIFKNNTKHTIIIFNESAINQIKKEISKLSGVIKVYIYSLGNDLFEDEFEDIENVYTETIPGPFISVCKDLD